MNEAEKELVLKNSQTLAENGEYEQALKILEAMECVMASWLKGKIYKLIAEKLAESFVFKFYATEEIKLKYLNLLNASYNYLYKTAFLLPSSSIEIRRYLNQHLWREISTVESKIARNRNVENQNSNFCDEGFDEEYDTQQYADYLIEKITEWNL